MDYDVMKKKLDTYRRPKGQFRRVNADLLIELLRMWELHTGPSAEFARQLGIKSKQLGRLVQQARKIATSSEAVDPAFHALQIQMPEGSTPINSGIEVAWSPGKVIRFPTVDILLDFLKKAS